VILQPCSPDDIKLENSISHAAEPAPRQELYGYLGFATRASGLTRPCTYGVGGSRRLLFLDAQAGLTTEELSRSKQQRWRLYGVGTSRIGQKSPHSPPETRCCDSGACPRWGPRRIRRLMQRCSLGCVKWRECKGRGGPVCSVLCGVCAARCWEARPKGNEIAVGSFTCFGSRHSICHPVAPVGCAAGQIPVSGPFGIESDTTRIE
jgi:hypothetical protein